MVAKDKVIEIFCVIEELYKNSPNNLFKRKLSQFFYIMNLVLNI